MNFHVMTLFPDMINNIVGESILGRAINKGLISVNAVNIRDYTLDKHNKVDDYCYSGGAGMLMQVEPIHAVIMLFLIKSATSPELSM